VVWDKFSKKLTNYLDTVTLGSLINETKTSNNDLDLDKAKTNDNDIDLEELKNYYQQN
jgi:FtsZ-binding cell division protein ZapB